ncbi:hypothetical protein G6F70_002364 [Rhizopus microsporus]|uniref:ABC transporter domain-containing protein n=2 Tax=Rhizopus TaxID=4842 RepID=A0A367JWC5_RHIAZ|nr:hypothetical protein G6F71_003161 [Rhizopus microsporus]RCH94302.1 hypothetical protein CU097_008801 [Rhizopus azygosporus]KAG1202329.1 hypothetical protein G6F70_002364 [Rhizopus microsporus]KAG1214073.1 hypothetical protein G6F69_002259 [Rhizopus microsporus]KAG1236382.1 hypothetical protein G6F67_002036 [Rhizopus microsporus]
MTEYNHTHQRSEDDSASAGSQATIATATEKIYVENGGFGERSIDEVNIQEAIDEYNDLKQELSRISRQVSVNPQKLEGGQAQEDEFNLNDFLHGLSESQKHAGHYSKHLGVVWKNLTVEGLGAGAHTIPTNISGFLRGLKFWKYFGIGAHNTTKVIIKDLTGFVKEGEMLLVLGRPGAGCTTLLRIISNMRGSFTAIKGTVSYGGVDPKTFEKYYRGQSCYNAEEDQHFPVLTLKQTLQFALRNKTPGARLPNETKKEFVNKILYMLGNMLGLSKQMHTLVGNAFVRGLSGGERKRLSIAEQMVTQSTINCWDCSTRGLDAASALDFVRSLRVMTDVFKKTTVATLYQASNSMLNLFDKVLILDDGYCLYFGPVSEAKQYFEDLGFYCPPRKSTPDFLTGISNPLEREIKPGYEDSAPLQSAQFQARYYQSSIYQRMMKELSDYENLIESENPAEKFKKAIEQEHQKYAPKSSPYTASYFQQVKALTIRQYHLQIKDTTALISRYGTILVQALITASCFYNVPRDVSGAFSRSGALFFCMLFNALVSQSELISFLTGRPVLEKHKQYALYHPSAFYIAQVIMDIPYTFAQVVIFSLCSYFMMGLTLTAGRFFTFFICLFFINMCMNGFFRSFGAATSSFFLSTQISNVVLIATISLCGYVIPYGSMHPWLSWIYWISPFAYGYKALLSNEMKDQTYSCEGPGNSVPYGAGYDDWNYKVCTLKGGLPGENFVLGDNYLKEALKWNTKDLWAPDFIVVVAYFLAFTLFAAVVMEFGGLKAVGNLTKLYKPGKAPKPRTPEEEEEYRRQQAESNIAMDKISTGTTFSWQNIDYTVPIKGGEIQLLNHVSGIVKPGHLTALMGSSGAGKTTLLDVLARRKTIGKIDGRTYLNGEALLDDFERITGYCEQMDIHQPAVTVREALRFSAYLRQPAEVPKQEKDEYVEQIIQLLEMNDIADAQVGEVETGFGISVEERKRLTIGIELVGKPQLLFLDEPTSGLDAQSSYNIIRFIRKLADAGWPVLCTIHQPSAILFEQFDHLLLLVRGGRTAYYGEIGKDARTMIDYFERNGGPICSPSANPAEYILEVVGAGTAGKATKDWADIWANSSEAKDLEEELEHIHQTANQNPNRKALPYATSFLTQFYLVHKRMALAYWRSPDYNIGRFISVMATSLLNGFTFWKLQNSTVDLQNRLFALFNAFLIGYVLVILAQPKFMTERLFFRKEYASRLYGWLPFAISSVLVEIPYILFFSAFYMCGFYWTAGLVNTSDAAGYFYIMLVFFVSWAVTFGFSVAAFFESGVLAGVSTPVVISVLYLFAGMFNPPSLMPRFWTAWMYWIDPFHYFIEGLATNELVHINVQCNADDFVKFLPPIGQTCAQYTQRFFEYGATGYIANPNATQPEYCQYCKFNTGEEMYKTTYGWDAANRYRDLGVMAAFIAFNVIFFSVMVYLKRKGRR